MSCVNESANLRDAFFLRLAERCSRQRIPLSGSIELTKRCNFRCIHCYMEPDRGEPELGLNEWLKIIDDLVASGTLFLVITGGEPLLHRDFAEIYRYAIRKGLLVTVFSNGSLLNDDILDLFVRLPPRTVEISLYGASESVYEKITGRQGCFSQVMKNIDHLVQRGIPLRLKTVFLQQNKQDLAAIQAIAERYGVSHRFDANILPRRDGDKAPLAYRLAPEEVVDLQLSSRTRIAAWRDLEKGHRRVIHNEVTYGCGAGRISFYIDAKGWLSPCVLLRTPGCSLRVDTFRKGWSEVLPDLWKRRNATDSECNDCDMKIFCGYCPAFFRLETGSEDRKSEFLCQIGKALCQKLQCLENEDENGKNTPKEQKAIPEACLDCD